MKDIFDLLNETDVAPGEPADTILTKKEQENLFQMILLKDKENISMKKSIKKALAAAAALAVIVSATIFNSTLRTIASNISTYFTGNTKTDYAKKLQETAEQDNGKMELLSVSREAQNIYLKVKFEFTEDISELTSLCGEYTVPGFSLSEDGKVTDQDGQVVKKNCTLNADGMAVAKDGTVYDLQDLKFDYNQPEGYVLIAPPFINSKILVNSEDFMNMSDKEQINMKNFPIYLVSARNTEISGNTLTQDIILYLSDPNYQEDIDISFQYKDIVLTDRTVAGEWNLDYTISGTDYEDSELNRMPIELSATDQMEVTYTLDSYAVTPGGIKIYGQDDWIDKMNGQCIVRIAAYDDLGNKYLMYPIYEDMKYSTYTIYNGPADYNNEYLDRLDENAKSLTIAFEQLYQDVDENDTNRYIGEQQASIISDELTLPIERAE